MDVLTLLLDAVLAAGKAELVLCDGGALDEVGVFQLGAAEVALHDVIVGRGGARLPLNVVRRPL